MRQKMIDFGHELVVDNFAGGGGASTGIEAAIGRAIDIAINHDPEAIAMHKTNHPETRHYCESVWKVDPVKATGGQQVGLAWFSPDCTHFSKARGAKPASKKIRGLAWVVVRWVKRVRPRVLMVENVEEFQTWGPLAKNGQPCPAREGETFKRWVRELKRFGYQVEWKQLRACDYGAPTSRKRLFLIARCDGLPIVWPKPTHGPGRKAYRTAAECIDWQVPVPSIFDRERPLAEATCKRIATGIQRYVVDAKQPFCVMTTDHQSSSPASAVKEPGQPLTTITTENRHAIVVPTLIQTGYGERKGQAPRVPGLDKPLGTVVAGGQKHALVATWLAKHYGGVVGQKMDQTLGTITAVDHHSLVTAKMQPPSGERMKKVQAFLVNYYGEGSGKTGTSVERPLPTIPTHDRFGLVMVEGTEYEIVDIGLRMLQPHELYKAQGFPEWYTIDPEVNGKKLTKRAQVRMCGNSVSPKMSEALVRANFRHEQRFMHKADAQAA